MKVEVSSSENFSIFINNSYIDISDYTDQDKLIEIVKNLVKKMKTRLNLKGFYKIKVYVEETVGLFVDAVRLDNLEYSNSLDLRVLVFLDEKVYFETEDYFLISDCPNIRFSNNLYYCSVEDISNIYKLVEHGRFVYGEELNKILAKSIPI